MKDQKKYIRTFIALDLPEPVKTDIYNCYKGFFKQTPKLIKWTKKENLHLTLKFLGDTDEALLPAIRQVMDNRKEKIPFQLMLQGFGTFPNDKQPKIFWVSFLDKNLTGLVEEQKRLAEELFLYGFPKENRKFLPHITIARLKLFTYKDIEVFNRTKEGFSTVFNKIDKPRFEINELTLFKSELNPQGAVYSKIYSA